MSIPLPLLQSIETLLNQGLQANPAKKMILEELADKVLVFELLGLESTVYVLPHVQGFYLLNQYEGEVDVRVRALPLTLLRYMSVKDSDSTQINISGDEALLEDCRLLTTDLAVDWELLLEEKTDNVFTNKVVTFLQEIARWRQQSHAKIYQNAGKSIQKSKLLPTLVEFTQFKQDLIDLEKAVDALTTKIDTIHI